MFTRQHFEVFAEMLRRAFKLHTNSVEKGWMLAICCKVFEENSENFDETKFLDACFEKNESKMPAGH